MGYDLAFAPGVEDDIAEFALTFPENFETVAVNRIEEQLLRLAANPGIAGPSRGPRPMFVFRIEVNRIYYSLAATFRYSPDEQSVVITGFRRLTL